jgi:hypothetical protein
LVTWTNGTHHLSKRITMTEPSKHGKKWTTGEVQKLEELAKGNTPTRVIALKLHRTPSAVESKAGEKNISLKPTNRSSYNRQKKS